MPTKKQPAPVTEPAPKKVVKKKVVKPAAQRVAEPEAPEVTASVEPVLVVPVLPAPEQHGEAVAPNEEKSALIDDLKEKLSELEAYNAHEQPQPAKLTLSQRWHNFSNSAAFKWVIGGLILLIGILIYSEIQKVKVRKSIKQTEQVEAKTSVEKGELSKTEANLSEMQHSRVDSNYQSALQQLKTASEIYEAYHAKMAEQNAILKKQNDAIQDRIASANDDTLRRIGSELSGH
jgi:hypothetical protein